MTILQGWVVPGLPHPLLTPDASPGYRRLRDAFDQAAARIAALQPDVLLVYSTMWPSVIGHQLQAHPAPTWVHVDELFHALGSIPYRFTMDTELARAWHEANERRGLASRTVAYDGFPIDTGSVVALKLLDPDSRIPAVIVSSNVYADRAETLVLAKAARDAVASTGRRAVAVVVSTLSNRLFTDWIDPADDHVHSAKDDEWNRKILEFLGQGRLEDVAQLSRTIHREVRVRKVVSFKPMWFLSALMGQHNHHHGEVLAYEAVHGTGGAVVGLTPTGEARGDKEFDEDDVEVWRGHREVLDPVSDEDEEDVPTPPAPRAPEPAPTRSASVTTATAAAPVGAYPHARRVDDLLYLSGVGPRQPGTDAIPGGPIRDAAGAPLPYDVAA
ncbi:MAG: hypothetical protein KC656_26850, partial [Myxococcales bacterium]|nr:hypothetical protein [Myxococcales bacterium]